MPYNLKEGWEFKEVRDQIILATQDQADFSTTLQGLAGGYLGGQAIAHQTGEYVLTPSGFAHFAERLGVGVNALRTFDDAPEIQRAMVTHMAEKHDDIVGLLVRAQGQSIQAVLSDEYVPIRNFDVAVALDMVLPKEGARTHRWNLSDGGRVLDMRILVPSWEFNIGNGHKDVALAGLHITNDELGGGKLVAKAALSKVACFNYTLTATPIFESAHRYTSFGDFRDALSDGVKRIDEFAEVMAGQLRSFHRTPIEDVVLTFNRIGEKLGVPQYALDSAHEYWQQTGGEHNLFAVVQSVTRGVQMLTENTGRRAVKWDVRNRLETEMLTLAQEVHEHGEQHLHTCVACGHVISEEVE